MALLDEAQRKAQKAKSARKVHAKKKAAADKVVNGLADIEAALKADNIGKISEIVTSLKFPAAYLNGTAPREHGGGFGPSVRSIVFPDAKIGDKISGRDVYFKTEEATGAGKGMGDMRILIRKWVNNDFYVAYDEAAKEYVVVGIGAEPADWKGPKKGGAIK